MKLRALISMLLFTLMLPGCSRMIRTERIVLMPPEQLLVKCVEAEYRKIATNRDLVNDRNAWRSAFMTCAANNDAIVDWLIKACQSEKSCREVGQRAADSVTGASAVGASR